MRITTLIENHAADAQAGLTAEHGLSLHIEQADRRILFDTGATGAIAPNAERLGIDLGQVDLAILSHHHYDHGGGLEAFFSSNDHAPVYLRPVPDGQPTFHALLLINRYIGLEPGLLERHQDRFVFVEHFQEVAPGVYLFARIATSHAHPKGNKYIYLKQTGGLIHDPFDHELVLAVRDPDGLVIFTGCAHNGALNMIQTVTEKFPNETIKGVVGGFHLVGLPVGNTMAGSKAEMQALANEMNRLPVSCYWTGHCTGDKAFGVLKDVLGERLVGLRTGLTSDCVRATHRNADKSSTGKFPLRHDK